MTTSAVIKSIRNSVTFQYTVSAVSKELNETVVLVAIGG